MAVGFVLLVLLHDMHIYRTHSVLQGSAWLGLELALPLRLPSMLRYCPGARGLDLAVVVATADFEPAQLTPVGAPGVATDLTWSRARSCMSEGAEGMKRVPAHATLLTQYFSNTPSTISSPYPAKEMMWSLQQQKNTIR